MAASGHINNQLLGDGALRLATAQVGDVQLVGIHESFCCPSDLIEWTPRERYDAAKRDVALPLARLFHRHLAVPRYEVAGDALEALFQ